MKLKVTEELKNYVGEPLIEKERKVLMRDIVLNALNYISKEEPQNVEQKVRIYNLSLSVYKEEEVEFTIEDLAFIKKNANLLYGPLIVGQIVKWMEK